MVQILDSFGDPIRISRGGKGSGSRPTRRIPKSKGKATKRKSGAPVTPSKAELKSIAKHSGDPAARVTAEKMLADRKSEKPERGGAAFVGKAVGDGSSCTRSGLDAYIYALAVNGDLGARKAAIDRGLM